MGFFETVGAGIGTGILTNLISLGLGTVFGPDQPKPKKKGRETQLVKSEAAKNLLAGGAPMRGASGLQGMHAGTVQQAAGNVYRGSPFLGIG